MKLSTCVIAVLIVAAIGWSNPLPTLGPYRVVPCDGAAQPVCIEDEFTAPASVLAHYQSLLTNQMFDTWFTSHGITCISHQPPPAFQGCGIAESFVTDVNNSGIAIGTYYNPPVVTQFVYDAGQIICCTVDSPFHLSDINDNGFIVGGFGTFQTYGPAAFVSYCCSGPNSAQTELPLTYNLARFPNPSTTVYLSIDDNNVIFARDVFTNQEYNLFPTPEPRSLALLATAFAVFAFMMRRQARAHG